MYCCSVCVRIQVLIDTSERACCFARFFCFVLLRFAMFCHFTFALPFFGVLPCSFLLFLFVVSPLPYFCFWLCVPPPGQWDMVTNLIGKYGVVPKSVCPESKTSSGSLWYVGLKTQSVG